MKNFFLTPHMLVSMIAVAAVAVSGAATDVCPNGRATLLTLNLGLTPKVKAYEDRRKTVAQEVVSMSDEVDFMCLQEVWYEDDMKNLLDVMEKKFPHHYSALHVDVGKLRSEPHSLLDTVVERFRTAPCKIRSKLNRAVLWCMLLCRMRENSTGCIATTCIRLLYIMPQDCRTCLIMAGSRVPDVLHHCYDYGHRYNRFNRPGLLVLSKQPLDIAQYVNMLPGKATLVERGYIRCKTGNNPEYVCTHLSAIFPFYYEQKMPFKNYEEQQSAEILQIYQRFRSKSHVLLGDLNTGPARDESGKPHLDPLYAANYEKLISTYKYADPYLRADGRCTFCTSENPTLADDPIAKHSAIDHVLTRAVTIDYGSVQRVMDGNHTVSDHFGIQLDICLP